MTTTVRNGITPYQASHSERERLRDALLHGVPALLVGPTGVGKTTLILDEVNRLGRELITVVGHADMTAGDLVGRWHLGAQGSEWRDGPLTKALRRGAVFYLDETATVPDEVLKVAFSVLDHRRALHLAAHDEVVQAASRFAFVGAYNPSVSGSMSGLSAATRQRFRFVEVGYLDPDAERRLLVERTGVSSELAKRLVECAHVTRNGLDGRLVEGASTRLLLAAAAELGRGFEFQTVVEQTILCALTDDARTKKKLRDALAMLMKFDTLPVPSDGETVDDEDVDEIYDGLEDDR